MFTVAVAGGSLGGWLDGAGPPVLLLHGGPGLSFAYLDQLAEELVAGLPSRGLPAARARALDAERTVHDRAGGRRRVSVLDGVGWERALLVGHSWGGQLALRLVAGRPKRVAGALAVDPLGVVGDGGMAAFEAEMGARTSRGDRRRQRELDERAMDGLGTAEDFLESLRMVWPAYFADPDDAPPMPPLRMSVEAYSGVIKEITADTSEIAAALAATEVPYGVLAGGASPIPWGQAARATAELSPRAFLKVIPGGGHFPWLEEPGCVRDALERLVRLMAPAHAPA